VRAARDVRERLGDDEVGGRLDRAGEPLVRRRGDLDRKRRAIGGGLQRRADGDAGQRAPETWREG
jgi:hypothetical protein